MCSRTRVSSRNKSASTWKLVGFSGRPAFSCLRVEHLTDVRFGFSMRFQSHRPGCLNSLPWSTSRPIKVKYISLEKLNANWIEIGITGYNNFLTEFRNESVSWIISCDLLHCYFRDANCIMFFWISVSIDGPADEEGQMVLNPPSHRRDDDQENR